MLAVVGMLAVTVSLGGVS